MSTPFLEIISAEFSAGEVKHYVVAGGYFEIIDCIYPVTVRLVDRYGTLRGQMNNAEASFYMRQGEFSAIEITSAQAQTVRFAYGSSEAGTRRTSGVVSVVDGESAKTSANKTFLYESNSIASAGNYVASQIFNPAGSGKNLSISQVSGLLGAAGTLYIAATNAAIGATIDNVPCVKLFGGTTSVAQRVKSIRATDPSTWAEVIYSVVSIPSGTTLYNKVLRSPFIVRPGFGLMFAVRTLNVSVTAECEYEEISIS